jgi:ABC-type nitrate/sulfonate/bicarbonate transport system ATPase subunit
MNIYPNKRVLEVKNLTKEYDGQNIIENIELSLMKGEFVSILGPSGCGKSTLFNVISGLLVPERGQVVIDGEIVNGKTGIVSYMHQKDLLLPWRNVVDNARLPLEIRGVKKEAGRKEVREKLVIFGLEADGDKYPNQLSGGMRQRVSLLRSYMFSKEIMLLDEPFGGLDAITKLKMQEYLLEVLRKIEGSVLFITHDIDEAIFLSDRIYILGTQPASVVGEIQVKLERPRNREVMGTQVYNDLRAEIMQWL